jgi:hypothetical protein
MANKVCMWHLQDTKWGAKPTSVVIHTLCVEINEYEFCMIDYAVNALDGYEHEWTNENIAKVVEYCKPILKVMDVRGDLEIIGVEFPKTEITVD